MRTHKAFRTKLTLVMPNIGCAQHVIALARMTASGRVVEQTARYEDL